MIDGAEGEGEQRKREGGQDFGKKKTEAVNKKPRIESRCETRRNRWEAGIERTV